MVWFSAVAAVINPSESLEVRLELLLGSWPWLFPKRECELVIALRLCLLWWREEDCFVVIGDLIELNDLIDLNELNELIDLIDLIGEIN